ncbi:hypothetical protein uav_176 [Pseudomonas phage UAVern]|uniref:Uncharacterized protein n=1 Tax=Pseudomonas phage UAVern TaxID=2856997 RepID=A0A975UWU2_9CAUD|nr:hypothetical protein uav_176 [Pseudomonas phage UAVern]
MNTAWDAAVAHFSQKIACSTKRKTACFGTTCTASCFVYKNEIRYSGDSRELQVASQHQIGPSNRQKTAEICRSLTKSLSDGNAEICGRARENAGAAGRVGVDGGESGICEPMLQSCVKHQWLPAAAICI